MFSEILGGRGLSLVAWVYRGKGSALALAGRLAVCPRAARPRGEL
jgi:hypothetical protein